MYSKVKIARRVIIAASDRTSGSGGRASYRALSRACDNPDPPRLTLRCGLLAGKPLMNPLTTTTATKPTVKAHTTKSLTYLRVRRTSDRSNRRTESTTTTVPSVPVPPSVLSLSLSIFFPFFLPSRLFISNLSAPRENQKGRRARDDVAPSSSRRVVTRRRRRLRSATPSAKRSRSRRLLVGLILAADRFRTLSRVPAGHDEVVELGVWLS